MTDRASADPLVWRQCVCDAWYWGAEQTDSDKAHSRLRDHSDSGDIDVERLRDLLDSMPGLFGGVTLPDGKLHPDFTLAIAEYLARASTPERSDD